MPYRPFETKSRGMKKKLASDSPYHLSEDAENGSNDMYILRSRQRILGIATIITVLILLVMSCSNIFLLRELKGMKAELVSFQERSKSNVGSRIEDFIEKQTDEFGNDERDNALLLNFHGLRKNTEKQRDTDEHSDKKLSRKVRAVEGASTNTQSESVPESSAADIETLKDSIQKQQILIDGLSDKVKELNATSIEKENDLHNTEVQLRRALNLRIGVFDALLNAKFDELQAEIDNLNVGVNDRIRQAILNQSTIFDHKIKTMNTTLVGMLDEAKTSFSDKITDLEQADEAYEEDINTKLKLLNTSINTKTRDVVAAIGLKALELSRVDIAILKDLNLTMLSLDQRLHDERKELNATFANIVQKLRDSQKEDVEKLDLKVQSLQNTLRKKVRDLNTTIKDKTDELKQIDEDIAEELGEEVQSLDDTLDEKLKALNSTVNEKIEQLDQSEKQDVENIDVKIGELAFELTGKTQELQLGEQNQTNELRNRISTLDNTWTAIFEKFNDDVTKQFQLRHEEDIEQNENINARLDEIQQNRTEELEEYGSGLQDTLDEKVQELDDIFNEKLHTLQETYQNRDEEMETKLETIEHILKENIDNMNLTFIEDIEALERNNDQQLDDLSENLHAIDNSLFKKVQELDDDLNEQVAELKEADKKNQEETNKTISDLAQHFTEEMNEKVEELAYHLNRDINYLKQRIYLEFEALQETTPEKLNLSSDSSLFDSIVKNVTEELNEELHDKVHEIEQDENERYEKNFARIMEAEHKQSEFEDTKMQQLEQDYQRQNQYFAMKLESIKKEGNFSMAVNEIDKDMGSKIWSEIMNVLQEGGKYGFKDIMKAIEGMEKKEYGRLESNVHEELDKRTNVLKEEVEEFEKSENHERSLLHKVIDGLRNDYNYLDNRIKEMQKKFNKFHKDDESQMKNASQQEKDSMNEEMNRMKLSEKQETADLTDAFKALETKLMQELDDKIYTLSEMDRQLNHSLSKSIVEAIQNGLNAMSETSQVLENDNNQEKSSLDAKIKEEIQKQKDALDAVVKEFQSAIRNHMNSRIQRLKESISTDHTEFEDEIYALGKKVEDFGELGRKLIHIVYEQAIISYAMQENSQTQYSNSRSVRLVGGKENRGTIEIYHHGEWGMVCYDGWDSVSGDTICKMLGYDYGSSVYYDGDRSHRRGRIWKINERCIEENRSIENCIESDRESRNCYRNRVAAVRCE